jgi:hypothetical protein
MFGQKAGQSASLLNRFCVTLEQSICTSEGKNQVKMTMTAILYCDE